MHNLPGLVPWRRTRIGIGITALFASPFWHLVGHLSTFQTLVDIGKFLGPTALTFLATWGWAISAPAGALILWYALKRVPKVIPPVSGSSVPHDLRIRDGRSRIGRLEIINSRGPAADLSNANVDIDHFTIRNDPPSAPQPPGQNDVPAASAPTLPDLPYGSFEALKHSAKTLATILQERERWYYEQWKQVMARGDRHPTNHSVGALESAEAKERVIKLLEERKKAEYLGVYGPPASTLWSRLCLDLGLSKDDPRFVGSPFLTNSLEGDWTMSRVADELTRLANLL